jgi:hypothetical protein
MLLMLMAMAAVCVVALPASSEMGKKSHGLTAGLAADHDGDLVL